VRGARLIRRIAASVGHRAHRTKLVAERAWIGMENARTRHHGASDLLILDDCFPNVLSAFRMAEFTAYLQDFPTAQVHSTGSALSQYSTLPESIRRFHRAHPEWAGRVRRFHPQRRLNGTLAYLVFLMNAHFYIETLEQRALPFVFTLYPGGYFHLNDPVSDGKLKRVLSSPMFRKVIVTQRITQDYLLQKGWCAPDQIEYVFGVVTPSDRLAAVGPPRKYGVNKETIDLCFVAHKYMPRGIDKGYDRFIETACALSRRHPQARFHVVGPFDESDIDVRDIRDRVTFHGTQPTEFFPDFYAGMDIILSPNAPFILAAGAFDGFPTGCCVEAGLCGVAVFCCDELRQNDGHFRDGEEIVLIPRDAAGICCAIERYLADPNRLARLARDGQRAFQRVYDLDRQMAPRLNVLRSLSGKGAERVGELCRTV